MATWFNLPLTDECKEIIGRMLEGEQLDDILESIKIDRSHISYKEV